MELIVKIGLELLNGEFYIDQQTVPEGIMQQPKLPIPVHIPAHQFHSTVHYIK